MSDIKLVSTTEANIDNNYTKTVCSYTVEYELLTIEAEKIGSLWDNDVILEITDANVCIYQREVRSNIEMFSNPLSKNEIAILKKDKPKSDVGLRSLLLGIAIVAIPFAAVLGSIELKLQSNKVDKPIHCEWIAGYDNGFDAPVCGTELEKAHKEGW